MVVCAAMSGPRPINSPQTLFPFRSFLRRAWLFLALVPGCGGSSSAACSGDVEIRCSCDDGSQGVLACEDGALGACECSEPEEGVCRSDAQCDDGSFCNGVEVCNPMHDDADEHGCVLAEVTPFCDDGVRCTIDSCSVRENRCVFAAPDEDEDGHGDANCESKEGQQLGDDCDDDDPERYPGNFEICDEDGVDEDCDETTFGLRDQDGDGAIDAKCCNGDNCGDDCNDKNIAQRPLQPEFCDDIDNNCDGKVDNDTVEVPWYVDIDGDGFGSEDEEPIESCVPIKDRSLLSTDCNDELPQRHPAQLEICDLSDNNCNGLADEGPDCGVPTGFPVVPGGGGLTPGGSGGSSAGSGSGGSGGDAGSGGSGSGGDAGSGGSVGTTTDITCDSRDLDGAVEWSASPSGRVDWSGIIHLTKSITIGSGAHLVIEEGTLVIVDPGVRVGVNGTGRIQADGTEDDPVKFCGKEGTPGYWQGLYLLGADPQSKLTWTLVADAGDGTLAGAVESRAPVTIDHLRVENSGDVGVSAYQWGFGSSHLTVINNAGPGLEINSAEALADLPQGGTFDGNEEDVVRIVVGAWNVPITLHNLGVPYQIKQSINQSAGADLVVEPGVEFEMEQDTDFDFGWNNSIVRTVLSGTEEQPIVFSGREQQPGFWSGLDFHGNLEAGSKVEHVEVRDAGGSEPAVELRAAIPIDNLALTENEQGLHVASAGFAATSKGISISNSTGVPLALHGNALVTLPPDTLLSGHDNHDSARIEIDTGTHISTSGTVPALHLPYYAADELRITGTAEVNLASGVHIDFNKGEFLVGWNSNAPTIHINGTLEEPVVFDHILQQSGGWFGLRLGPNVVDTSTIDFLEIRNAGGGTVPTGALVMSMNPALPADHLKNSSSINSASNDLYISSKDTTQDYSGNGNSFPLIAP